MHTDREKRMNTFELDAEYNLISLLLDFPERRPYIFENCDGELFTNPIKKQIFETAQKLYKHNEPLNAYTIAQELNATKEVIDCLMYIQGYVWCESPLTKKVCSILYDKKLQELIENAHTDKDIQKIEEFKQAHTLKGSKITHISEGIENFEETYLKKQQSRLVTGYPELDENIGSFSGGDYIALGGGTGMGKTTIALNIARQLCLMDKKVLYCSLEMPLQQLQNRFNCINTKLNALKYRACTFNQGEMALYKKGLNELKDWNLSVLCEYDLTIEKLRTYLTEKQKTGLDFVIIDHLGLMSGFNNKSLYEKATSLSRQIKILATDLNVPIMVLVQLNRDLKNREDKMPVLSDIRESGAIEQDADYVLFAHRPYVYDSDPKVKNNLQILIAKNRHGISNVICNLKFNLHTQEIWSPQWNS
jgi:replicative DNA helicase